MRLRLVLAAGIMLLFSGVVFHRGPRRSYPPRPGPVVVRVPQGKLGPAFRLNAYRDDSSSDLLLHVVAAADMDGIRFEMMAPPGWTVADHPLKWEADLIAGAERTYGFSVTEAPGAAPGTLWIQARDQRTGLTRETRVFLGETAPVPPKSNSTDAAGHPVCMTEVPR